MPSHNPLEKFYDRFWSLMNLTKILCFLWTGKQFSTKNEITTFLWGWEFFYLLEQLPNTSKTPVKIIQRLDTVSIIFDGPNYNKKFFLIFFSWNNSCNNSIILTILKRLFNFSLLFLFLSLSGKANFYFHKRLFIFIIFSFSTNLLH